MMDGYQNFIKKVISSALQSIISDLLLQVIGSVDMEILTPYSLLLP